MQAGELHARFLSIRSSDMYARGKQLHAQCESTLAALVSFRTDYEGSIPAAAAACVDGFIDKQGGLIRDTSGAVDSLNERAWGALVLSGAFETQVLLADEQEIIRTRSELQTEIL
jgi:hypothetical protein